MNTSKNIFKVIFQNQNKIYEIYARGLVQSNMLGFIEIEDLIFGERSGVVVDPSEEKLANEFAGVKRIYVPLHSIIRIDEVEKERANKIYDAEKGESNVTSFPSALYTPKK